MVKMLHILSCIILLSNVAHMHHIWKRQTQFCPFSPGYDLETVDLYRPGVLQYIHGNYVL